MVYSDRVVAALKVNGRVLREDHGIVTLPFGSEYSIFLRNLNSVRVQVAVSVDGQAATGGMRLIIAPNSFLDLERFMVNGNLHAGNRFKFVERTKQVERHRGVGAEDGLIRVEAWTEEVPTFQGLVQPQQFQHHHHHHYNRPFYGGFYNTSNVQVKSGSRSLMRGETMARSLGNVGSASASGGVTHDWNETSAHVNAQNTMGNVQSSNYVSQNMGETGITVPGSESHQQFHLMPDFPLKAQSLVLVLQLRGELAGKRVGKAVTVKTKTTCPTCGKKNKPGVKFCADCGTATVVI